MSGGTLYRLRGHDQFFTRPGESHDTANLPQERGVLYWIILSLGPGRFLGLEAAQAARLKRELRAMPHRHFRAHPDCSRLLGEIRDLLLEHRRQRRHTGSFPRLRLQAVLLEYLTLSIRASRQGAHGAASPLLQRVLAYVDAHLDEPVHVPRMAEIARLSESRLKSRFKQEIGVPPAEYWLRKKIERAVTLLPTRSITDIAYALGFSSSNTSLPSSSAISSSVPHAIPRAFSPAARDTAPAASAHDAEKQRRNNTHHETRTSSQSASAAGASGPAMSSPAPCVLH